MEFKGFLTSWRDTLAGDGVIPHKTGKGSVKPFWKKGNFTNWKLKYFQV